MLTEIDEKARLREIAASALTRYAIAPDAAVELINISENATFRIDDPGSGRTYALRVHRDGYHSPAGIASELAWLVALRRDKAAVTPVPVAGRDGEWIQTSGHPTLPRPRNIVLFEWEDGVAPSEEDDLTASFATLGETAARMHRHVATWRRPADFERFVWDFPTSIGDRPHWGSWRVGLDPGRESLFARAASLIERRLARFGTGPERFGLVHADLRLANLLVHGDRIKVLDFDDSGFSWFLYDAATAVSFFEHDDRVPALLASWAEGYRRVSQLGAEEETEIASFVMLRRLLLVAWIASHADTDLARSMGPAYVAGTDALCDAYLTRFG